MELSIDEYNESQLADDKAICNTLASIISTELKESTSKVWHAHPVWFLKGNPIVGYSKEKKGIRLMFWSGASFDDEKLNVRGKKFMDASIFYTNASQIIHEDLVCWLQKAIEIQWDYKNIVKRKGQLIRL